MHAKITTDRGTMTVEFFEKDAPNTVANFVKLAKDGFYDGLKFHRVIPGFVAQGGCPHGIGNGGPGYTIDCELDGDNQHHDLGVLSMAHAGRNTGGSQFFIVHSREATAHLDRNTHVLRKGDRRARHRDANRTGRYVFGRGHRGLIRAERLKKKRLRAAFFCYQEKQSIFQMANQQINLQKDKDLESFVCIAFFRP